MKVYSDQLLTKTQEFFFRHKPTLQSRFVIIVASLIVIAFIWFAVAPFEEVIKTSGFIRPETNISSVSNAITGKIKYVDYKSGKTVKKGDLLLSIDPTQILKEKENLMTELEKEYYSIVMKKTEAEYQEQTQRHRLGQKANVELFNSHMSYVQASLSPDKSRYNRYSDFSRSLRELTDSLDNWSLSGTIGVRLGLDFNSQGKAIKEISDRKIQNLNLQLDVIRDEQEKMRSLYQKWSVSFSTYCTDIEHAMEKEEEFRKDMKSLLEKNLITEAEFWTAESGYYEVRLNYYKSVWQMIQGKLNILRLSSDWMEFINQFMEN